MKIRAGRITDFMEKTTVELLPGTVVEWAVGGARFAVQWDADRGGLDIRTLDGRVRIAPLASNNVIAHFTP